jgi:hypothetical protein
MGVSDMHMTSARCSLARFAILHIAFSLSCMSWSLPLGATIRLVINYKFSFHLDYIFMFSCAALVVGSGAATAKKKRKKQTLAYFFRPLIARVVFSLVPAGGKWKRYV